MSLVMRGAAGPATPAHADTAERAAPRVWHPFKSPLLRYFLPVPVVLAVTLLRVPLSPLLGNSVPFLLYFPALVFVGWLGGFGPGLIATLLSAFCAKTWFFEPVGSFTIQDAGSAFRLLVFLLSGGWISYLCGRLHGRTAELEAEKVRLEATVRERTEHLERALQDMESFSYTVSHDLRAPMRTMRGFSDILLEDHHAHLPPDARSHLERIRQAAVRLDELINDLLALAKVSGSAVATHAVDLRSMVQRVLDSPLRSTLDEATVVTEGCRHTAIANDTLLQQVLQNLIENAAKFVAPGVHPQIRVWSETRGDVVRLWIEDNGIGVAPADQERLFKVFERGNTKNYSGTGIGLAIVDRAMAKMNGRVGLESELGQGSKFWLELPAA